MESTQRQDQVLSACSMKHTPTVAASCSHYLDRVEVAVAVQREADDMCGVVVPAGVDGVAHDVADFRKHVFDQGLVAAERDPLAQVGGHAHHQALAGAQHPAQLLVLAPALQLGEHGLQLEVPGLLIQQTVVLRGARQWGLRSREKQICVFSSLKFYVLMFTI